MAAPRRGRLAGRPQGRAGGGASGEASPGRAGRGSYDEEVTLLSRLRDGSLLGAFGRDVTYLTSGAVIAQAILIVAQLALARIYDPAQFGAFSVVVAWAAILSVVATLRYEMAVPLAADDAEALALTRLCLRFALGWGVVAAGALAALAAWRGGALATLGGPAAALLVPLVLVATSAFTVLRMLASRRGAFGRVGRAGVGAAVVQAGAQVGLGLGGLTGIGLAAGYGLGRVVNAAGMGISWREVFGRASGRRGEAAVSLRVVARRWRRMPLFNTFPALLNVVSVGAVAPLLTAWFSLAFAGQFGFATRLLAAPAVLLGQAVSTVFFPRVARMERESADVGADLVRACAGLVLVAVPVFATVSMLGPEVFAWLFTAQWREAGILAALLAPWLATNFVSSPLSSYATVRDQLGRIVVVSLVEAALRVGGLYVGVVTGRPLLGAACYSLAGVAICAYFVGWVLRLGGADVRALLRWIGLPLLLALVVVAGSLAARLWAGPAVVVAVGVVGALALLAASGVRLRRLVGTLRRR